MFKQKTPEMLALVYSATDECRKEPTYAQQEFCLDICLMPLLKLMVNRKEAGTQIHPTCNTKAFADARMYLGLEEREGK